MARILIIDDDESVRSSLGETLIHFGHTVFETRNGKDGLEQFAVATPDLVITDIVMPGKDGLEVLMALRKKKLPVKIIAMSGGGMGKAADYLRTAQVMGATKVLSKPFTNAAMMAAINELVPSEEIRGT